MRKPIEVLWIDDESKKDEYKIYYSEADEHGINLNSFQYEDPGLVELNKNFSKYDAVLIDVITQKHEGSAPMDNHLSLINRINDIFSEKKEKLPLFIFTGKSGIGDGADHVKELYKNQKESFFVKLHDDERLWKVIRDKVLNSKRNEIKERHGKVLDCAKLHNDKIYSRLLTLVFHIEGYMLIDNLWAEMRSLLDDLINTVVEKNNSDLFKKYLINQDDGRVMLGNASFFLEGTYRPFKDDSSERGDPITHEDHWDKYMTDLMRNFIPILQALNHSVNKELRPNQKQKKAIWEAQRGKKNLQMSVVYQLFMLVEYIANRYYKNS
tara:strand:- start:30 stop:1001 length:972 start_codon:yes stop_codon:yes gene_type:complete